MEEEGGGRKKSECLPVRGLKKCNNGRSGLGFGPSNGAGGVAAAAANNSSWQGRKVLLGLKRRRLILSDSESESEDHIGPQTDQNRVDSAAAAAAVGGGGGGKEIHGNIALVKGEGVSGAVRRIRSDEPTKYMLVKRDPEGHLETWNDIDTFSSTSLKRRMKTKESLKYTSHGAKQMEAVPFKRREPDKQEKRGIRVLDSKKASCASAQGDQCVNKKQNHIAMNNICNSEDERMEWSGQRTHKMSKDRIDQLVGVNQRLNVSYNDRVIRVQGKSGVLRLLPNNKNFVSQHRVPYKQNQDHSCRESKLNDKGGPSTLYKSHIDQGEILASKRNRLCGTERKTDDFSSQIKVRKNDNNFDSEIGVTSKRKTNQILKTANLDPKSNKPEKVSRITEKQMVRNQLRDILMNAGWNIEYRPRRNRNYEDAVYVSPQGTGYWSITKAYAVFMEQSKDINGTCIPKAEESSEKLLVTSHGKSKGISQSNSLFPAIPVDALSILKRNVVNKRTSKKDIKGTGKKCGDLSRSKMPREAVCMKSSRNVNGTGSVSESSQQRKKNRRGCKLMVRNSSQGTCPDADDYVPYNGKRTILAWMIDSGSVPENGTVKYTSANCMQPVLKGQITRDGIHCYCCSEILSVSKFESHSENKLCQPYRNIVVQESGSSLFQCLVDAWERQEESDCCGFSSVDVNGDDPSDDTCGICGDGGDLICCDGCPSTFHQRCLGFQMLPLGDWLCSNCLCKCCGMVDNSNVQGNFCSSSQLLSCSQCEKKYHEGCILDVDASTDHSDLYTFCGPRCRKLFQQLQDLLGVKRMLGDGFSWSLVQRVDFDSLTSPLNPVQRAECNAKISVALSVMDECFLPIVDQRSGISLVHNVVYNRRSNFNRLNHGGFYTFILERDDEIIAAASVRFHGNRFAEMPFIGTRDMYRRQGMCRLLLNAIEMVLSSLNVEKLVIPAISELVHTWTTVFGFKPLNGSSKSGLKYMNMLVFPGTGLLEKQLIKQEESPTVIGGSDHAAEKSISHHSFEAKDEIVGYKTEINISSGSIFTTSEMVFDCSEDPCGSDIHASQCQSLGDTAEVAHSLHSILVYETAGVKPESHCKSSIGCQIRSPCGNTNQNTSQVKMVESIIECNESMHIPEQHTSRDITMLTEASDSSLLDSNECIAHIKTMRKIPENSVTFFPKENDSHPSHEPILHDNPENEGSICARSDHCLTEKSRHHTAEALLQNSGSKEARACCA